MVIVVQVVPPAGAYSSDTEPIPDLASTAVAAIIVVPEMPGATGETVTTGGVQSGEAATVAGAVVAWVQVAPENPTPTSALLPRSNALRAIRTRVSTRQPPTGTDVWRGVCAGSVEGRRRIRPSTCPKLTRVMSPAGTPITAIRVVRSVSAMKK